MSESATTVRPALRVQVARLIRILQQYSYRTADESRLQEGIAEVLLEHGFQSRREHVAGDDRFDFLLDGGIVIEVKIAGSWSEAIRQAERYCRQDFVAAVILASSRRWQADRCPQTFHGKPVHTVLLRGRF